jgi:hypothetical protein
MTWNYRVMRHESRNEVTGKIDVWFALHEVFYENKNVNDLKVTTADVSYTTEPIDVVGDSVEDLRETLRHMLAALDKPVLDYR